VTYEKTPDYFDRDFVPERIRQMNQDVKIISILCDPVRRAYSHFLHAIVVQKNADNGNAMPGWYWLEGHTEFNEVVRITMRKILKVSFYSMELYITMSLREPYQTSYQKKKFEVVLPTILVELMLL